MRFLPLFLDLTSGRVLLVGAGEPAQARLRLLLAAGARVRWFAPDGSARDVAGFDDAAVARIELAGGDPLATDLAGVVAVLCAGAGDTGRAVAARARSLGIPVNVMDEPTHSTFIVPAIVDRGEVVVAIGTGGASPVIARRLRERIEALLPVRIGDLASFAARWRDAVRETFPDVRRRRRFWERVIDGPVGADVLAGRAAQADQVLATMTSPAAFARASDTGVVTLVGAGPGDPDLLTLKALRALQDADVIFYDDLVSSEILARARRDAALVPVGRRAGRPGIGQDAIHRLLIDAAHAGQRVVRLKGGDPFIFGRGGEEVAALRAAGVACAVIPGITAALGAAAEAELPLTFRHEARRVTFLTAHRADDAGEVDWPALTDPAMTVVVYMGMTAAPAIRDGLLKAGRSPQTPVGVFARATRPDAKTAVGVLRDLPALAAAAAPGPALLIIGDVVAHSAAWRSAAPESVMPELLEAAE
jgi:uroporphyrin-III C-methyltransferase/precorrin-2 dehydrogenase/sirohydrochlorin ferrochelatase